MADEPSTPDSDRTMRSTMPSYQPLKKYRLYELGDAASTTSSPPALNPLASPFNSNSNATPNALEPFGEGGTHPPQHQVQHSTIAGPPAHQGRPSTSSTPATSLCAKMTKDTKRSQDLLPHQAYQTSSIQDGYTGIPVGSNQIGNLTLYGTSYQSSLPSQASSFNREGSSTDNTSDAPFTPSSARHRSSEKSLLVTPSRSKNKVPEFAELDHDLLNSAHNSSQGPGEQTKTFPQLTQEKGLRRWDHRNLDDRWLLQSDEMSRYRLNREETCAVPSGESLSDGGVTVNWSEMTDNLQKRDRSEISEDTKYVPLPPDAGRLDALVKDLQEGGGLTGLPYSPRLIRSHFYQRVFNNGGGPEPLDERDANMMTWHRRCPKTLKQLRDELLDIIEDLVLYLTSPVGQGWLKPKEELDLHSGSQVLPRGRSFLSGDASATRELDHRLNQLKLNERNAKTEASTTQRRASTPLRQQQEHYSSSPQNAIVRRDRALSDLQRIHDEVKPNISMSAPASFDTKSSNSSTVDNKSSEDHLREFRQASSRAMPARSQHSLAPTFSQPNLQQINEGASLNFANPSPSNDLCQAADAVSGSFTASEQSPYNMANSQQWSMPYNPVPMTPYNTLEKRGFAGNNGQQFPLAQFGNSISPAQMQYLNQSVHYAGQMIPPVYSQQFLPQMAGTGIYSPNGISLPVDRNIRPAATNRIAPLFAQTGAWHANQRRYSPQMAQPSEWQNRFGPPINTVPRDSRKLAYLEGSDEMSPRLPLNGGASVRYQSLARTQVPDPAIVLDERNLPFTETARAAKPAEWGVMKIGNIPYNICKAQIVSFLGNHAKVITPELGPSVHIIMERATGKTQDCFVEFFSTPDAKAWVDVIKYRSNAANRLEDRVLEVELSSQDQLMKELFPRAKNIDWRDGQPLIVQSDDPYNTGFKTFVSTEELQILVRHAEQPHRSNYTLKCPNRPYEAMISLLSKFPWQATSLYSLGTRNKIFDAAIKMMQILSTQIRRANSQNASPTNLSNPNPPVFPAPPGANFPPLPTQGGYGIGYRHDTGGASRGYTRRAAPGTANSVNSPNVVVLRELLSAALNATGFSERQRWELHQAASDGGVNRGFLISPLSEWWPFEVLGRRRGFEEDVVEWYAQLIAHHPLVQPSTVGSPFGNLEHNFQDLNDNTTTDEAGHKEWEFMTRVLMDQCNQYGSIVNETP
ncbi:uncharacterized protein KY384_006371 [Bacidia gigantensis]|uniref:uncharacterized protein n=1 Tax=Bacidia gigantensis TaxID=2732470 RepID=UPI001D056952|nr:uncharacterized protein KY384_006371 [Bacidia gigantensis]KAG8528684.1 hypothetical protein KY384_006371 [Bacidia gigantensis]